MKMQGMNFDATTILWETYADLKRKKTPPNWKHLKQSPRQCCGKNADTAKRY